MLAFTSGCSSIFERHFADRARFYPGVRHNLTSPAWHRNNAEPKPAANLSSRPPRRSHYTMKPVLVIDLCSSAFLDTLLVPYDAINPPEGRPVADQLTVQR